MVRSSWAAPRASDVICNRSRERGRHVCPDIPVDFCSCVRGLELGAGVTVDFHADADFNDRWCRPLHDRLLQNDRSWRIARTFPKPFQSVGVPAAPLSFTLFVFRFLQSPAFPRAASLFVPTNNPEPRVECTRRRRSVGKDRSGRGSSEGFPTVPVMELRGEREIDIFCTDQKFLE